MTHLRSMFLVGLLGIGCGGSTDGGTGTGGAGTGGTGTGGTGTGGTGTGGAGTGGTSAGGTGTGGSSASGGSSGSGGGNVGGSAGGGGICVTDSDCGQGVCGYPISAGCAAVGQCFPTPGPLCDAYSPACACDGTVVSVICEGLPQGYTKKPVAYVGACGAPFACGDALTCNSASEYCKVEVGGPCCGPPSYSCDAIPESCQTNHSCACIQTAVSGQMCSESGGAVTVTFLYP